MGERPESVEDIRLQQQERGVDPDSYPFPPAEEGDHLLEETEAARIVAEQEAARQAEEEAAEDEAEQ